MLVAAGAATAKKVSNHDAKKKPTPQLARTHPVALQHCDGCSCRSHLPTQCVLVSDAQRQVRAKGILPERTSHTCTHSQIEGDYHMEKGGEPRLSERA